MYCNDFHSLTLAPSGPPTNVFAEALHSTIIFVTWDEVAEVDQNGVITSYEVVVQPFTTFNGQIPSSQSLNVSTESAVLLGLEEFVEYNVTVRAFTVVGPGPFSEETSTITDPASECIRHFRGKPLS